MTQGHIVFERRLLRARYVRAMALGLATFLIERVAADFGERLATILRQFDRALDLGTPTGELRRVLADSGKVGTIVAASHLVQLRSGATARDATTLLVAADEEALQG